MTHIVIWTPLKYWPKLHKKDSFSWTCLIESFLIGNLQQAFYLLSNSVKKVYIGQKKSILREDFFITNAKTTLLQNWCHDFNNLLKFLIVDIAW